MTKPVVALCMPIYNKIDPRNMESYRFLDRAGIGWHHLSVVGWPVDVARNMLTAEALATPEITHLLWVDDDMVYPSDSLKRLLARDVEFVGGLCFDRRPPYKPVIARYYDPSWGFDAGTLGWFFDYPRDQMVKVDATGGAFLLVKADVFRRIREVEGKGDPAWKAWWTPIDGGISEDLSLCKRAQATGTTLWVDTSMKIGHVGEVVVDEAFAMRNRQSAYHRWHPSFEALADAVTMRPKDPVTDVVMQRLNEEPGQPIASVIIPTFNQRPAFLAAAIQSALAQTAPVEVIVVDDGSVIPAYGGVESLIHDQMAAAMDAGRLVWCRHTDGNKGIGAALNTGIRSMSTDWFAWLSSDDLFEPEKIERQMTAMLNVNALAGYTGYNLKTDNANGGAHVQTLLWADMATQRRVLARNCAINGSTVLVHKSVFAKSGTFDVDLRYAQDWDYWRRVGEDFLWHGIPDKLTTRREFGNLTATLKETKNPRKEEEDKIVMGRYSTAERVDRWYDGIACAHRSAYGTACEACVRAGALALFAQEGL